MVMDISDVQTVWSRSLKIEKRWCNHNDLQCLWRDEPCNQNKTAKRILCQGWVCFVQNLLWRFEMICMICGKALSYEKIITPDGRVYHMECWNKDLEIKLRDVKEKLNWSQLMRLRLDLTSVQFATESPQRLMEKKLTIFLFVAGVVIERNFQSFKR